MKQNIILALLLCITSTAMSQQSTSNSKQLNPVNKGYYSIGNNQQKLSTENVGSEIPVATTSTGSAEVKKGYYGIERNARKLPSKSATVNTKKAAVVTKGYYSIGNNAEKLNHNN